MSYTLDYSIALGPGMTGLTLAAQLVNTSGASVGSEVTTGFTEIGDGNYLWHYTAFPDGHRGGVKFYEDGAPGTILAFAAINPEEAEYTDDYISDIAAGAGTIFPAGAINFTYTITDSVTALPIEGVEVWISTDSPAVNIVWKGDTDAFGVARDVNGNLPALDAGTYYFWRQKAGYIFSDPDTEVVS